MSEPTPKPPRYGVMSTDVYATYRDERNRLTDSEQEYGKTYDKYVVTLSGGAIALSLAFLKDIVGDNPITGAPCLVWAWVFLGLAIGTSVAGLFLAPISFARFRDVLDEQAAEGGDNYWARVRAKQRKRRLPKVIPWLNALSLLTFLAGLLLLMWFTYGSVNAKGIGMNDKLENDDPVKVTPHGATISGSRGPSMGPVERAVSPAQDDRAGTPPPLGPVDRVPTPAPPSTPPQQPTNGPSPSSPPPPQPSSNGE
ncbi:MAG TPA: hypothetical protein VM243_12220 [Phycisphaerae bacterium]|nr:hypothetical protein [Phycisphaerae bacterium]